MIDSRIGVIYKTLNLLNGKFYVGRDVNNNPKYLGSGVLINLAVKKYGRENFKKEILEYCEVDKLDEREIYWIEKLNAQDKKIGYNLADGGHNYFTMNEEIKSKISSTLKGKYVGENSFRHGTILSEQHKENFIANAKAIKGKSFEEFYGTKKATEISDKMSKAQILLWKNKDHWNKMSKAISKGKTGTILTKEHRSKIGKGLEGRIVSDKTREKLRTSNMNKKQKHSISVKVLNEIDGKETFFSNISYAARTLNTSFYKIKNNKLRNHKITIVNETSSN